MIQIQIAAIALRGAASAMARAGTRLTTGTGRGAIGGTRATQWRHGSERTIPPPKKGFDAGPPQWLPHLGLVFTSACCYNSPCEERSPRYHHRRQSHMSERKSVLPN